MSSHDGGGARRVALLDDNVFALFAGSDVNRRFDVCMYRECTIAPQIFGLVSDDDCSLRRGKWCSEYVYDLDAVVLIALAGIFIARMRVANMAARDLQCAMEMESK